MIIGAIARPNQIETVADGTRFRAGSFEAGAPRAGGLAGASARALIPLGLESI